MPSGDPFKIFREAGSSKQETLQLVWPELYDALFVPAVGAVARQFPCPICKGRYPNESPPPIVGRLTYNGHPACRGCLDELADRPGGWPLERQERPRP